MKLQKKTLLAFAHTDEPAPEKHAFYAISRVSGKEVRQLACYSRDKELFAVCRKQDGTLKILGKWHFKVLGWQSEPDVSDANYRDKEGNCPGCAGCDESRLRAAKKLV